MRETPSRSDEHTSELQSPDHLVCRLLLEKKKVSASQKAWMASPGIAIAAVGPRARAAGETARMPRFYWDFAEARTFAAQGQTPWTPAISVVYGLHVGVARLRGEGTTRTWARHAAVAAGVAAGVAALGLRLVAAPAHRSPTVTAA